MAKVVFPGRSGQRIKLETAGLDSTAMTLDFDPTVGPIGKILYLKEYRPLVTKPVVSEETKKKIVEKMEALKVSSRSR